jgi:hypothetical protein
VRRKNLDPTKLFHFLARRWRPLLASGGDPAGSEKANPPLAHPNINKVSGDGFPAVRQNTHHQSQPRLSQYLARNKIGKSDEL